ncbi:MAG: hypothetical protein ACRC68_18005 [Clostridium sp.]
MISRKINNKLDVKTLACLFKVINPSIKFKEYNILIGDGCEKYADMTQPIIKVIAEDGNWYRVYVDKEYSEITWY